MRPMSPQERLKFAVWGLLPLVLLGGVIWAFFAFDPTAPLRAGFPPVEELTIERIELPRPGEVIVYVVNGGPEPVTIAQVLVNEAYWRHTVEPDRTVPRLGRARVVIPYPWVEGEPLDITLLSSIGLRFEGRVEVAVQSPRPNWRYFAIFSLLGAYVGLIPVFLGLGWFPFLKRLGRAWMGFLLSLTAGLLLFLGVDALEEALEIVERLPSAFQGGPLLALSVLLSFLGVAAVQEVGLARRSEAARLLGLSYFIALGVGLHNLGEGLAIGAAYALGEVALGTLLVLGFTLHNTTEGIAIVAPLLRLGLPRARLLLHLALMGVIAGGPTITGTWIGGFVYSDLAALIFFGIGAGAIFEVIYEIVRFLARTERSLLGVPQVAGLLVGLLIMYLTGLLVAA